MRIFLRVFALCVCIILTDAFARAPKKRTPLFGVADFSVHRRHIDEAKRILADTVAHRGVMLAALKHKADAELIKRHFPAGVEGQHPALHDVALASRHVEEGRRITDQLREARQKHWPEGARGEL
eukprot:g2334.t1